MSRSRSSWFDRSLSLPGRPPSRASQPLRRRRGRLRRHPLQETVMFVAPLALPESASSPHCTTPQRAGRRRIDVPTRPTAVRGVLAWLAGGLGVLALLPAARGDALFGATLPFWLVAAPLLDLAWLWRRALRRALRRLSWRDRDGANRPQARRLRRPANRPGRRTPAAAAAAVSVRAGVVASAVEALSHAGRAACAPCGAGTHP